MFSNIPTRKRLLTDPDTSLPKRTHLDDLAIRAQKLFKARTAILREKISNALNRSKHSESMIEVLDIWNDLQLKAWIYGENVDYAFDDENQVAIQCDNVELLLNFEALMKAYRGRRHNSPLIMMMKGNNRIYELLSTAGTEQYLHWLCMLEDYNAEFIRTFDSLCHRPKEINAAIALFKAKNRGGEKVKRKKNRFIRNLTSLISVLEVPLVKPHDVQLTSQPHPMVGWSHINQFAHIIIEELPKTFLFKIDFIRRVSHHTLTIQIVNKVEAAMMEVLNMSNSREQQEYSSMKIELLRRCVMVDNTLCARVSKNYLSEHVPSNNPKDVLERMLSEIADIVVQYQAPRNIKAKENYSSDLDVPFVVEEYDDKLNFKLELNYSLLMMKQIKREMWLKLEALKASSDQIDRKEYQMVGMMNFLLVKMTIVGDTGIAQVSHEDLRQMDKWLVLHQSYPQLLAECLNMLRKEISHIVKIIEERHQITFFNFNEKSRPPEVTHRPGACPH